MFFVWSFGAVFRLVIRERLHTIFAVSLAALYGLKEVFLLALLHLLAVTVQYSCKVDRGFRAQGLHNKHGA